MAVTGLIIQNLSDGTSQTVLTGGIGFVTVQSGDPTDTNNATRSFLFKWNDHVPALVKASGGTVTQTWLNTTTANATGDLAANAAPYPIVEGDQWLGTDGSYEHYTPAAFIAISVVKPGIFFVTITIDNAQGTQYCGLQVRVVPFFNLPPVPALSWVPGNLIDLVVDLNMRTVASAVLSHAAGLKQGDDFTLAVIPYLPAGTLVITGITAMSLALLNEPGSDDDPIVFAATGSPPTLTEVGGDATHQYYSIVGNLRDQLIQGWFDDLNDAIDKANAAAPTQAPTPHPGRINASAALSITTAAGVTTTESFPFPILQST